MENNQIILLVVVVTPLLLVGSFITYIRNTIYINIYKLIDMYRYIHYIYTIYVKIFKLKH